MNKIKLLYDVVQTMRGKGRFQGEGTLEIQKDQKKIFFARNVFEKNILTREGRAEIETELDYGGKRLKHQSTTEFSNLCGHHRKWHGRMHGHLHGGGHPGGEGHCCGIRGKLSKLSFLLQALYQMEVSEEPGGKLLLTLDLAELPEDVKTLLQEKIRQGEECHQGEECPMAAELKAMRQGKLSVAVTVNGEREVEKAVVVFDGLQTDAGGENHELSLVAKLSLQ